MKILLLVMFLSLLPTVSYGQQSKCVDLSDALINLEKEYSETPIWVGKAPSDIALVLTSTKENKTWTLIIIRPDGMACPLAAGTISHLVEKK